MPYISPIEATSNAINSINISHGTLIIDTDKHRLMYDTATDMRISLSSIELINTEAERLQYPNAVEGKLYIVKENARPYIYIGNGAWVSLTVAKNEVYNLFFVDPVNGNDDNDGISMSTPFATIGKVFSKYPDFTAYNIKLYNGSYDVSNLTIQNKFQIALLGEGNTTLMGNIKFSSVSNVRISGCNILDLNASDNTVVDINNSHIYENGIIANNGSIINIKSSTVSDSVSSSDGFGLFTAMAGSSIMIDACSGATTSRPIYHAAAGSSICISKDTTITTNYSSNYTVASTGRIYFEADPTDAETKAYITDQISAATTESKTYTDEQIAAFFTIEEV